MNQSISIKILFFIIALCLLHSCKPECKDVCTDVTDNDGNVYKTVCIGDQCWMAENLKVTRYRNGDTIPKITNDSAWKTLTTGAFCDYANNPANSNTYGRLYNWWVAHDTRGIAPVGWHIPTRDELATLENYLGGYTVAGYKMKVTAGNVPPWNGSNTSGLSVLPAGYRFCGNGQFVELNAGASLWSNTEDDYNATMAWVMGLNSTDSWSHLTYGDKNDGCSIRCIKDQ